MVPCSTGPKSRVASGCRRNSDYKGSVTVRMHVEMMIIWTIEANAEWMGIQEVKIDGIKERSLAVDQEKVADPNVVIIMVGAVGLYPIVEIVQGHHTADHPEGGVGHPQENPEDTQEDHRADPQGTESGHQ